MSLVAFFTNASVNILLAVPALSLTSCTIATRGINYSSRSVAKNYTSPYCINSCLLYKALALLLDNYPLYPLKSSHRKAIAFCFSFYKYPSRDFEGL
jgi:hypothetical protein